MKNMFRSILFCILLGGHSGVFSASLDIQKEVVPFPGGSPKVSFQYVMQEDRKVLHGLYETYFASGEVWQQYRFDHGKLQGKCLEYNQNGKKKWAGEYAQDLKVGSWTYWDRNGIKKLEVVFSKTGQIQTLTRYNQVGRKRSQEWFENGKSVKEKKWEKNGKDFHRSNSVEEVKTLMGGDVVTTPIIENTPQTKN